ncbi:MAG: M23 family metallopeptidase, partial [Anaerolineaceae bacterium]|nr:M23 family metallopeptidase [Anaerolineaceae bacterium]
VLLPSSTPTPTLVVSSMVFAPEELCPPIAGVEFYELQSIISQPFNVPNPFSDFGHHGVDFGSYNFRGKPLLGTSVQAVFSGEVVGIIVDRPPIGNTIILETRYEDLPESLRSNLDINEGQSLYHLYAHLLESPEYWIGETVECGEEIAHIGSSQTVEAHLHLETTIGSSGYIFSSMAFYDTSATEEEQNTYLWWRTSGDLMPLDPMNLFTNFK